jgi:NitT/TauT family transport system substrate-binding protein
MRKQQAKFTRNQSSPETLQGDRSLSHHLARCLSVCIALAIFLQSGCGGPAEKNESTGEPELTPITIQMDWYAQPEHGGFYQALAKGFYREVGLDVTILPGGPNALVTQKVAQGRAEFAIGRSDDVILHTSRGVPLMIGGALMQKDPQAILFHKESGIKDFPDLDGRTIMAGPGSAFILLLEKKYGISLNITPLDYGMSRFLADKNFIQQCFITNEPYYVGKEGANYGTLLISDSGFEPYRVWYFRADLARNRPEIVKAFNEASVRGWQDYMFGDRSAANKLIAAANPKMTAEFMDFVHGAMLEHDLITGDGGDVKQIGTVTPERLAEQIAQLIDIGMLDREVSVEAIFDPSLLPRLAYAAPALPAAELIAQREPTVPMQSERSRPDDLEIFAPWPGSAENLSARYVSWENLAGLGLQPATLDIEFLEGFSDVEVLPLQTLLEAVAMPTDLILADCSDGYQSNYTPEVVKRNKPVVLMRIDGQPFPAFNESRGHPERGPYLVQITETEGLTDPVNKNPWGVSSLVLTTRAAHWEPLTKGLNSGQSNGLTLFKANCLSCHNIENSPLGGHVSNRNKLIVATHAKYNVGYFREILRDPVGTMPTAKLMPASTHYTDAQIDDLIAYLRTIVP